MIINVIHFNFLKKLFQIGRTTTETRLVVTDFELQKYSHTDYEDLMFHHNTITRTTYFEHDIEAEGIDHCYDCSSEIWILSNYLQKISGVTDLDELKIKIGKFSEEISKHISTTGRTLNIIK